MFKKRISRILSSLMILMFVLTALSINIIPVNAFPQTDLLGPAGSGAFGQTVTILPNGNIVVTDPLFDAGATGDVGAAYLYNGATLMLISTLTGSSAGDQVSSSGVMVLANGNYVVRSVHWANGAAANAGAVTWCSASTGCGGLVSAANSLVGSHAGDEISTDGVVALSNGNYVIQSPRWANGAAAKAGATTWCSGTTGCKGEVSPANSLVGTHADDQVGFYPDRVVELANGNYVVPSPLWDNGAVADAGAVTWCSGTSGCSGEVSAANSRVGSTAGDEVGGYGVTRLPNGSFVVNSPAWANGAAAKAGAVTWCSGTTGCTGEVTLTNSLAGSHTNDRVGLFGVVALTNSSYVVDSYWWDNSATINAGAVTWCSGTSGCAGAVTPTNSLVGTHANDQVGYGGVAVLTNGNYVASSIDWNNGAITKVGAVTHCSGTAGCTGPVTSTNSLVGSQANDQVGFNGVSVLTNGSYVVSSMYWDNSATTQAGAVTWCSGTIGCSGIVTATNSLVGTQAGDQVNGAKPLSDGNYVVNNPNWANGAAAKAGAVTWCSGTSGCTGPVTTTNSLVGSQANDQVGYNVRALPNGSYVVSSSNWANAAAAKAGAVTWCSGAAACKGAVTASNSLVGSSAGDQVGDFVTVLGNGNYVVSSLFWNNVAATHAGAVTWCSGTSGCTGAVTPINSLVGSSINDYVGNGWAGVSWFVDNTYVVQSPSWDNGGAVDSGAITWRNGALGSTTGTITSQNSVLGTAASGGFSMNFAYDVPSGHLVVGRPADNKVTVLYVVKKVHLPFVMR